jgi:hypothetical protein
MTCYKVTHQSIHTSDRWLNLNRRCTRDLAKLPYGKSRVNAN